MLNYWWVTRPKRKLTYVPDVLAAFVGATLDCEWLGERATHLTLEKALEEAGLKRIGERRDQTGGGGRTYKAWLVSLGLIFVQTTTKKIKLTLAGEAIMRGDPPVPILTNQVLKYQFPSSFSVGRGVDVSSRFRIRPFRFLLRLLSDQRLRYLTKEEIAKIVVTEADKETDVCFEYIVSRICEFRSLGGGVGKGDQCLSEDFCELYKSSKGVVNDEKPFDALEDIANTMINWLEYTQLICREGMSISILPEKAETVALILAENPPFIDRPEEHEFFQRKYGLDLNHKKDTRNLNQITGITARVIAENHIKKAYISESLKQPITKIDTALIDKIVEQTGFAPSLVEDTLKRVYPNGSIGAFMTEYFEMAFKGKEEATDFEKATATIFKDVFRFRTKHVGPTGLNPDVLIVSDSAGFSGIIDNKAYHRYSVSNDHYNRMVHNYIPAYQNQEFPLAFFSYIAGGFTINIDSQLKRIVSATHVNGSAVSVCNVIKMIERQQSGNFTHAKLRDIFSLNRQVLASDLDD